MVGRTNQAEEINRLNNWNLSLTNWYDWQAAIDATAQLYNITDHEVVRNYNTLLDYI